MAQVKFGMDQLNSPAPKWWRRLERALIVAILPATAGLIMSLTFKDPHVKQNTLMVLTFAGSLVKGIGMFLGNGQEYLDPPADDPKP